MIRKHALGAITALTLGTIALTGCSSPAADAKPEQDAEPSSLTLYTSEPQEKID